MLTGIRHVGWRHYGRFRFHRMIDKLLGRPGLITLTAKNARFPLQARGGTSDLSVFSGVFVRGDYACLDHVPSAELIIDCGANVGYSTAYFLSRFPAAKVIAVEPDSANFALLTANMAPYGDSVQLEHAAVWSHSAELTFCETPYRDGRHWSRQMRVCAPGEPPATVATDIGTLLARSGCSRISILKIDIEGAEGELFSNNYEAWIDRVDHIAIELHDDSYFGRCTDVFRSAVDRAGFQVRLQNGITVASRVAATG